MNVLPFQKSIQNDLLSNKSCLLILSRGLGAYNIIYNFLYSLDIKFGKSVLLLNLSVPEVQTFRLFVKNMDNELSKNIESEITKDGLLSSRIEVINSDTNIQKRTLLYEKGGIYIITSRILLTDALSHKLKLSLVDGIIVMNAESLNTKNWNDAFILQLFKTENSEGFVKGISQRSESLIHGYFGPGIAMRYLGTMTMYLYSRHSRAVEESFKQSIDIKVTEKSVKATEYFYLIQKCLILLIEKGLNEILKLDQTLEISISDLLYTSIGKLQSKIESITQDLWKVITQKHKQLLKDILILRNLLEMLYLLDSSMFFLYLELIRYFKIIDISWILTPEFESLFKASRSRVFKINRPRLKKPGVTESLEFTLSLEVNPIYIQLIDLLMEMSDKISKKELYILKEEKAIFNMESTSYFGNQNPVIIDLEQKSTCSENYNLEYSDMNGFNFGGNDLIEPQENYFLEGKVFPNGKIAELPEYRVLIVVPDELCHNKSDLEYLLFKGPQNFSIMKFLELSKNLDQDSVSSLLQNIYKSIYFGTSISTLSYNEKSNLLNELRLAIFTILRQRSEKSYSFKSKDLVLESLPNSTGSISEVSNLFEEIWKKGIINPKIIISNPKLNVQGKFWNTLCNYSPHLIIILDPELSIIREIEVYAAMKKKRDIILKVVIITIQESIRHEKYIQTIKNEENSWNILERHKRTLVVPLNDLTDGDIFTRISTNLHESKKDTEELKRVIVDSREFRSSLPYRLFCKGIQIIPLTLEIGDYVISRDVCIERKSIKDLISSLNNGRLYTQLQWLTKHYKVPVVLIELENSESLNNRGKQQSFTPLLSNTLDIYNKLILLIRHFPTIKFIWSGNASFSSSIILHIKNNREQPDIISASELNVNILNKEYNNDPISENENNVKGHKKRKITPSSDSTKSSYYAVTFLRQLPGVNSKNISILTSNYNSLKEIMNSPIEELVQNLGISNGTVLYRALHDNFSH
ncbi:ERCC4 domain-containing protein [Cryptosporidium ryanae]|uniref:ERCC4 domain-containing protein n=1 Tax=Cryptosporidium ryanae TaxID=515981 RepID=UPI00351A1CA5|nr:ERCC4 domain-containing protein [Cryptosporidium ryanae]